MKIFYKNGKGYAAFIFLLLIFSTFVLIGSCKKFVEIPPPNTQLVTTSVFANNSTATSAQIAIYAIMWGNDESYNMAANMGLYADELQNYSTVSNQIQLYTNSLPATAGLGPWDNYYQYIFYANSVISGLQTTSGCSVAVKKQLTGEALFIRAFCHFYLANTYGDVPIVLTTNPNINSKIARSSRMQVFQQVIADLQSAQTLLNSNYVDGSDTVTTTERVRPNKAAALALMARAYLYLGDYSKTSSYYVKADSAASAVITNSEYNLSPLSGVFLENSTEAIWQWQTPQPASVDTPDGDFFILEGAPSTDEYNSTTISTQLLSSFEPGDQRLSNWIGSITEGGTTYYYPYKYKVGNAYENQEYTMVLRLGEQYLIRAEGKAELGDPTAVNDLNAIRNRAGLPNYTGAMDKASLLTAILHERQVELFAEWGHRWFDLERAVSSGLTVNAATVLGNPGNVCRYKGGTWSSNNYQLLFPVPQGDINTDPNLKQNSGY